MKVCVACSRPRRPSKRHPEPCDCMKVNGLMIRAELAERVMKDVDAGIPAWRIFDAALRKAYEK